MSRVVAGSPEYHYLKVMLSKELHLAKEAEDLQKEGSNFADESIAVGVLEGVKESIKLFARINSIPSFDVLSIKSECILERNSNLRKKYEKRNTSPAWINLYNLAEERMTARRQYHEACNYDEEKRAEMRLHKTTRNFNNEGKNMSLTPQERDNFLYLVKEKGEYWNDHYKN